MSRDDGEKWRRLRAADMRPNWAKNIAFCLAANDQPLAAELLYIVGQLEAATLQRQSMSSQLERRQVGL